MKLQQPVKGHGAKSNGNSRKISRFLQHDLFLSDVFYLEK